MSRKTGKPCVIFKMGEKSD